MGRSALGVISGFLTSQRLRYDCGVHSRDDLASTGPLTCFGVVCDWYLPIFTLLKGYLSHLRMQDGKNAV